MASHFECLGFPLSPDGRAEDSMAEFLQRAAASAEVVAEHEGGIVRLLWSGPAGEELHFVVALGDEGAALLCATPSFRGGTRTPIRVLRTLPSADCGWCDFVHFGVASLPGAPENPLFAELKDAAYSREADLRGARGVAQVNLLAQQVEAWADRDAFLRDRGAEMEPRALVPTGLLGPTPRPVARAAGEVEAATVHENPLTGLRFVHARIATHGTRLDLLAAGGDLPGGLRPGQVVLASGTLLARFPDGVPEAPEGGATEV
jgi:hypothetical protein